MTSLALMIAATGVALATDAPNIPFEKYELDNGLEVILAPDDSTPIAFVQTWYKVGSRDEEPGLTGFAHLFEHLLFQGTVNVPGDYFVPLQEVGAQVNGSTSFDRTEYHEEVPSQHLPLALFMESERLGWTLPVLDQDMLDNQREVVKNERRQNYENPPYGEAYVDLFQAAWPEGHPYRHMPIGSHADLEAADLGAVRAFFERWYVPNNASLVISGHFDTDETKALVEKYFGPIPRGPQPETFTPEQVSIPETRVIRQYQDVPEQKFWIAWTSPALYAPGDAELDLLSSVLSGGKDSRLYKALVRDQRVAKDISAYQMSLAHQSLYLMAGTASKGHTTDEVIAAADAVIAEVLAGTPPSEAEIEAAKASYEVGFYRRLTTVSGKGQQLSSYNALAGDPGFLEQDLARYVAPSLDDVVAWGRKVLTQPRVELHIWPAGDAPADATPTDEETK